MSLLVVVAGALHNPAHAVVPIDVAREMASRWRPDVVKVSDSLYLCDRDTIRRYTAAAIAMRCDDTFGVCGDVGNGLNLYILKDRGRVHEVCAILWSSAAKKEREAHLGLLVRWHASCFDKPIRMGDVHADDMRAWSHLLRLDDDHEFFSS